MLSVTLRYGTRHLTLHVPPCVDELTVQLPQSDGNGWDEEKPVIILTDRM
jgi:hypothetical protein